MTVLANHALQQIQQGEHAALAMLFPHLAIAFGGATERRGIAPVQEVTLKHDAQGAAVEAHIYITQVNNKR